MVILRPMLSEEFSDYLDYFIWDYAREISSNYGKTHEESLAQARLEVANDLEHGVDTVDQVLLCIENSTLKPKLLLGYMWYAINTQTRSVFLNDFYILPSYQGEGTGKAALRKLEDHLVAKGLNQIRLRVAFDNERAQHLYATSGYRTTGVSMSKSI